MDTTRRNLISTTALAPVMFLTGGMAGGAIATCGPNGVQIDPAIIDEIEKVVAGACNWIPAFTTIVALVGSAFPALVGATTITDAVLSQVSAALCALIPTPHPATGKYAATAVPNTQVAAHGWIVGPDGKLIYV
jgi:hypothetical protein